MPFEWWSGTLDPSAMDRSSDDRTSGAGGRPRRREYVLPEEMPSVGC
ncbi:MAG: hypothetical protein ACYDDU_22630 [Dermatophilaceae bacterium]